MARVGLRRAPVDRLPRRASSLVELAPLALYATLAAAALAAAEARGASLLATAPAMPVSSITGVVASATVGVVVACATVSATPLLVARCAWARALHGELAHAVQGASTGGLILLGAASAAAEELLFRGLLTPWVGVVASSLAFGALHRARGQARLAWTIWATVMGLVFGTLFVATGSLVGPLLAHAIINVRNLRYLRDTHVLAPSRRELGGLLRP